MKLLRKLQAQFRRGEFNATMAEEMQAHLDGLTARNIAAGMTSHQ